MTEKSRLSYVNMTPRQLETALKKKNLSAYERRVLISDTARKRKLLIESNAKKRIEKLQWSPILTMLRKELNTVQSSLDANELSASSEDVKFARYQAYTVYRDVLVELNRQLREIKASSVLPITYARDNALPNEGVHWADYVPENVKTGVQRYFGMIPDSFRAKRKEPFLRVMGKADWNDDAEELRNTMYRIFADAQRELSVLGSVDVGATNRASAQQCEERIKELRDRKSQLVWCQAILASLNYKTALPRTWRGLFALKRKESL